VSPFGALLVAAAVLPASLVDPRTETEAKVLPGGTTHLVFFATWCSACVDELPALAELRDRHEPRGHRIVVVAVRARQDAARLRAFLERQPVPGTLLWDRDGALAARLGVVSLPAHILLGPDGSEIGRWGSLEEGIETALRAAPEEGRR
jgi:thiol-disulfide isomerase/thioredoxin